MKEELKSLRLKRDTKFNIGKRMGAQLWIHKNYIEDVMTKELFDSFKAVIPDDFVFHILRWNERESELAFIQCNDFDTSHEPIVGQSMRVVKTDDAFQLLKQQVPPKNPLIYHHKWFFVKDDYLGFDVEESKERSVLWKSVLGVSKTMSSRIGRLSFWDEWLKENNLPPRIK